MDGGRECEAGVCVSVPAGGVEEVEVRHAKELLEKAGDVPLDVARTILASHYRTLRSCNSAGVKRLTGGFVQCPSCSTPWMADLCRPRLLGCPRSAKSVRRIARRSHTHPGKLTRVEKSRLGRYRNQTNAIEVLCLACGHRKEELFALPERDKKEVTEEKEEVVRGKRRKKKRKGKELNAGLMLANVNVGNQSDSLASTTANTPFNTSTQVNVKNTPDHLTPEQRPRAKRAKVTIKSVSTPHSLPVPLTNAMKEKRKAKCSLKKVMGKETARSDLYSGGGKAKNSLSSFLDSLL